MREKRDFNFFLQDSLNSIGQIKFYVKDMTFKEYLDDKKTQDAVIRNLEIIGEASKNIPKDIKENYPDIPWKEIAGMRDKIAHEYFGVDLKIVWQTIQEDLPFYEKTINRIKKDLF